MDPRISNDVDRIDLVLRKPGAIYYDQGLDLLVTKSTLDGSYLIAEIQRDGPADIRLANTDRRVGSLLIIESQLDQFMDGLDRQVRSRFSPTTGLEQLRVQAKKKYYYHSSKGRNFLITRVGTNINDEPIYRVYECLINQAGHVYLDEPKRSEP